MLGASVLGLVFFHQIGPVRAFAKKAGKRFYGFGARARGGKGPGGRTGSVYTVTTLSDGGPGSLRAGIEQRGPRTIVFSVSGAVNLRKPLIIKEPFITIAGETAPSPGIAVMGDTLEIAAGEVIITHLRIFVGDRRNNSKPACRDGIRIVRTSQAVRNIVIDHCTISAAIDESVSTSGKVSNITISNCIIADALNDSLHPKGPHSKGILINFGARKISLLRNLLANNFDRNPRIMPGASVEFVNNLVYGWGGDSGWSLFNVSGERPRRTGTRCNIIGNVYRAGPDGTSDSLIVYPEGIPKGTRLYLTGNKGSVHAAEYVDSEFASNIPVLRIPDIPILSAADTYSRILKYSGARPSESHPSDMELLKGVILRTGFIKDRTGKGRRSTGGYPVMASNRHRASHSPQNPGSQLTNLSRRVEAPRRMEGI